MPSRATALRVAALLAALVPGTVVTACGSGDSGDAGKVTVFAAASLTEAFTELGAIYEQENDGAEIEFNFAASSDLAAQIDSGAPADVFASADEPNMEKVTAAKMNDGAPQAFAGNVLEIAVPKGNPGGVEGIDDLARKNLLVTVCDLEVPCGNAAREVFAKAGVEPAVDTYEPDVKSVLTKVELGEVDAGLVYHSDVLAAGEKIDSITIPAAFEVINTYPIVLLEEAADPEGGRAFIDIVLGDAGQAELEKWGFRNP